MHSNYINKEMLILDLTEIKDTFKIDRWNDYTISYSKGERKMLENIIEFIKGFKDFDGENEKENY